MPFDLDVLSETPPPPAGKLAGFMSIAADLGDHERAVLQLVAERLRMGQRRYGRFDVGTDRRDFRQEALEEVADALVYGAALCLWHLGRAESLKDAAQRARQALDSGKARAQLRGERP